MTEKRFYTDGQYVMQKGEVWVVAGGEHSADVIATALNELIEEKNKLQFDYNMEILTRQSIEKENKLLKQEKEELLDKILECQKALSRKRTKEEPHWHKYGNNEGYTKKTDLDIRFCGDVE